MKSFLYICCILFEGTLLLGATIEPGNSSNRHKTDYTTGWNLKEAQIYTVSAAATGCSFVDSKTRANGGATLKSHSSAYAAAEKSIEHTDIPNTTAFGFSISGVLDGSSSGGEVTWSATLQQKFFWLELKEKIVAEGVAVTVTANGAPTESLWTINNKAWKDWSVANSQPEKSSNITLNRDMWDKMQWTPTDVSTNWKCPPAGVYNISATTTETTGARSADVTLYVLKLQDVRVRSVRNLSSRNVLVKTGDKVNISVTALPSDTINGEKLPFRWSIRQLQHSGEYGAWSVISAGNDKSSFEYSTNAGGIFQIKVEVKVGDVDISAQLMRQSDDPYGSGLTKNSYDAFGVCDSSQQILMCNMAAGRLGSNEWRYNASKAHPSHGTTVAATFPEQSYKCNLFVCESGHIENDFIVPLINETGIWPLKNLWPPTANQWAGVDSKTIPGWTIVATPPQPGYVWANGNPGGIGHCGIMDYDGRVISAQSSDGLIGRKQSCANGTLRQQH